MVNIFDLGDRILRWLMKFAGVRPRLIEIEPGTLMNFWVPTRQPDHSKPALVFLHGFAANAILTWQFQVLSLAKSYDVYLPELIFFGTSITDRPDRSLEFQGECVIKGLRKLGVEKFILVGFSYGVMVGFKIVEMFPDSVVAMVVTSAAMASTTTVCRPLVEKGIKTWSEFLIPDSVNGVRLLFQICTHWSPPLPDWVFKHYLEAMIIHREERAPLLDGTAAEDEVISMTRYPEKIHIIWGVSDQIFDLQIAYKLKEQVGGKATVDFIEKAGHLVQLERPWVYNKCLKTFLDSLLKG